MIRIIVIIILHCDESFLDFLGSDLRQLVGGNTSPTHLSPSINDKQHLAIRGIRLLHNFHLQ